MHEDAFKMTKQLLTSASILTYFDASREICLHTDAGTIGIGFFLLQKSTGIDEEWKVVQTGSRFLTDMESRYVVIKLECLMLVWNIKNVTSSYLACPTLLL